MHERTIIFDANCLAVQRLAAQYLAPNEALLWTIEDACVTARKCWSRSGVPADATSYRYVIEHPDQDWTLIFRAVWRQGQLFRPSSHVILEPIEREGDRGAEAISALVNEWLQSLYL